jgi:two-component system, chemotaxis family, protein-glutamate methylesterase/glutaminase
LGDLIKALIVDDSKLIRRLIHEIFDESGQVQVVGEAGNGAEALEMLPGLNPDIVTMDVNMPVMDGLTALKHIMIKHPKPIVMLSTYTQEGERVTFDALKYGAIDFIAKPSQFQKMALAEQRQRIIQKVTMAAKVELEAVQYLRSIPKNRMPKRIGSKNCNFLFAMGASIGGYSALLKIIPQLRTDLPAAFLAVLYVASDHLDAFVNYLDEESAVKVKRAVDGDLLKSGVCYMASGDEYVTVHPSNGRLSLKVNPSPFPSHQGAINMLMFSLADAMKHRSIGVILSGSGEDGVEGISEILRMGGIGIVQDPLTCLCQETPQSTLRHCKVDLVFSDWRIPLELNELLI